MTPARRRSVRDESGATLVEFGLLLVPFILVVMTTLELGYTAYVNALIQGALQHAAREAVLGNHTAAEIDAGVKDTLRPLVRSTSYPDCDSAPSTAVPLVCTTMRSYYDFSRIGKPEKLIDDKNGNGAYDSGDCYEDANDNNVYDDGSSSGRSTSGNADEVVLYTVKAVYKRIIPMDKLLGWSANKTIVATTTLRNQPFADDVAVVTRCN